MKPRWSGSRIGAVVVTALAGGLALSACSATSSTTPQQAVASGQSHRGGTLYMAGTGDVDYMDPNASDYTVGNLALRMWTRQLLTYPAVSGATTTVDPDLATGMPAMSDGGLTYTVTIRAGADWNTSPVRQVTAADAVRGLELTCNPVQPNDQLPDYETLIVGMTSFCTAFEKAPQTVVGIRAFLSTHSLAGATVDPSNPLTVVYKLTHPATYFPSLLALSGFTPAPVENLNYLPASFAFGQNTISDGPYEIQSYAPGKSILFVRNPAWKASTDPIRKAYVNEISVNETVPPTTVQQELQANSPDVQLPWGDTQVPLAQVPALLAEKSPNLFLGPSEGLDPFIVFNFVSPNDNSAMASKTVRQALSYALDRAQLIQDDDGSAVSPALTQLLPPGVVGSSDFNPYPYNQAKAKQLLGSLHLKLKFLYQADSMVQSRMFQTVQYDLSLVGVTVTGVGVPTADIYTKYLEVPSVAKSGVWDIAFDQWYPDWYGNNAVNYLVPLAQSSSIPPGGDNMGFYESKQTDALIQQGIDATTTAEAAKYWQLADEQIMQDAAVYPINSPQLVYYHSNQVQNAIYVPDLQDFDPTNVWLSSGGS
jgi:peptide/nickel transport system substrate-binding protein